MWIVAVCGLGVLVMVCVILLLAARKKNKTYRMRSNTDTSMLSHLTAAAARSDEEQGNRADYENNHLICLICLGMQSLMRLKCFRKKKTLQHFRI